MINRIKDPLIFKIGSENTSTDEINIYSHGTPSNILYKDNWINSPDDIRHMLDQESEQWRQAKDKGDVVIVLHSCRTGREKVTPKGTKAPSVAQEMSKFLGVTVIAPDERDAFYKNGIEKPMKANKEDQNGEYTSKDESLSDDPGHWNIFKQGKWVGQYDADWHPKAQPTWWDKFWHKIWEDPDPSKFKYKSHIDPKSSGDRKVRHWQRQNQKLLKKQSQ